MPNDDHDHGQGPQRGPAAAADRENKKVLPDGPRTSASSAASFASPMGLQKDFRRGPGHRRAVGRVGHRGHGRGPRDPWVPARSSKSQFDGFVYPAFDQIGLPRSPSCTSAATASTTWGARSCRLPFQGGIGAIQSSLGEPRGLLRPDGRAARWCRCSNANDAYWMIQQSIEHDDPIIFCEPMSRYWGEGRGRSRQRPPGAFLTRAVRREGNDVTVVGYGASLKTILRAAAHRRG